MQTCEDVSEGGSYVPCRYAIAIFRKRPHCLAREREGQLFFCFFLEEFFPIGCFRADRLNIGVPNNNLIREVVFVEKKERR